MLRRPSLRPACAPRRRETNLNSASPIYDLKPWVEHYGTHIPRELGPPRHAHLPALLRAAAERHAAQVAFTTCMPNGMHGSLTFRQVYGLSDDFAVYLRQVLGLAPGARVAIQTPNCLAYPVVAFGILKAGCVLVNVNPLYTPAEMAHQLGDSGAEALVIVDMFANKLEGILERTALKQVIVAEVSQFFSPVPRAVIRGVMKVWNRVLPKITVEHVRLAAALAEGAAARQRDRVDVAAYTQGVDHATLAVLQYTGGTTGVAKGAMLTHGNLLHNIEQSLSMGRSHLDEGREVVLTALPPYHIFAFTFNLLCFYAVGARNVLVPSPRPVQNLQRAIENHPITWITGVNTLYNGLLNEEWFLAYPPKHLKASIAGGTALHQAVAARWREVTSTPIAEGYGLTETSPVVSFNPLSGTPRHGGIGIPAPGTQVRLVNDAGQVVVAGEPGEIQVRGPQVMQGYWNQLEETAKVLKDGWLSTGDVAVMDAEGFLRIVDRKKDLVLVSGFNVYPNEVEDVVAQMDAVLDVAVIGVPDAATGEAVRVYVVPNPDHAGDLRAEDVVAHCKRQLTAYKVPRQVVVRDELPKSPVGKVLRKDLRAEALAEMGQPRS